MDLYKLWSLYTMICMEQYKLFILQDDDININSLFPGTNDS